MHDCDVASYREFAAPAGLACVWIRSSSEPGMALVLPDGCTDLIWSELSGELLIAGPDTKPHPTTTLPGRLMGVRFPPGVGPSVFGVPGHAIRDQRIAGWEVWRDASQLAESLNESDRPLRLLTSIATARLQRATLDPLAAVLRRDFDVVSFTRVAATAGYADQAHLSREVRALAGIPLSSLVSRDGRTRAA